MVDGGLGRRAGFGIKLCLKRLGSLEDSPASASGTGKGRARDTNTNGGGDAVALPKRAKEMDALVTGELLKAYGKGECELKGQSSNPLLALTGTWVFECSLGEPRRPGSRARGEQVCQELADEREQRLERSRHEVNVWWGVGCGKCAVLY